MQLSVFKICLLAVVTTSAAVCAQDAAVGFDVVLAPKADEVVPAGKPYTIKWTPGGPSGTVSIILLQGKTNTTLQLGDAVAQSIDSAAGQYDWDPVPSNLKHPLFGLKIQLDSDPSIFQYSNFFTFSSSESGSYPSSTASPAALGNAVVPTASLSTPSATSATSATSVTSVISFTSATSVTSANATLVTLTRTASGAPFSNTSSTTSPSIPQSTSGAMSIVARRAGLLGAVVFSMTLIV
ncbi:MAG: hypothetical protein M1818_001412 [Claussenomyces sp. TS43310]|nr:MAG: hypothetical protein M1818_001412 [Claussenomyces sp. TS43310]